MAVVCAAELKTLVSKSGLSGGMILNNDVCLTLLDWIVEQAWLAVRTNPWLTTSAGVCGTGLKGTESTMASRKTVAIASSLAQCHLHRLRFDP